MPTDLELQEVISEYIQDEYLEDGDETGLENDTPLISSGIVDSFSMVSLKTFLESHYNIQIPDNRATPQAFDSINSIVALVKSFL